MGTSISLYRGRNKGGIFMKKTPISRAFIAIASFFIAMPLVACASDLPSGISSVEDTHISSFVEDVSYSVSIEGGVEEGTTVKADELTDGQREAALDLIAEENVCAAELSALDLGGELLRLQIPEFFSHFLSSQKFPSFPHYPQGFPQKASLMLYFFCFRSQ